MRYKELEQGMRGMYFFRFQVSGFRCQADMVKKTGVRITVIRCRRKKDKDTEYHLYEPLAKAGMCSDYGSNPIRPET